MPTDAKLGLFLGILLVVTATWVYRQGTAERKPAQAAVSAIGDTATQPVLAPNPSH
jgi:hypothetical protein